MVYKGYRWNPNFGLFPTLNCYMRWHLVLHLVRPLSISLVLLFFSAAPSLVFEMPAIEMRNKQTMNTVFALSWWSTRCKFDDSLLYGQIIQCILFQFSTPTTIRIRLISFVLFVFFVHSHLFSIWTLNLSESKWDWFDKI